MVIRVPMSAGNSTWLSHFDTAVQCHALRSIWLLQEQKSVADRKLCPRAPKTDGRVRSFVDTQAERRSDGHTRPHCIHAAPSHG